MVTWHVRPTSTIKLISHKSPVLKVSLIQGIGNNRVGYGQLVLTELIGELGLDRYIIGELAKGILAPTCKQE